MDLTALTLTIESKIRNGDIASCEDCQLSPGARTRKFLLQHKVVRGR